MKQKNEIVVKRPSNKTLTSNYNKDIPESSLGSIDSSKMKQVNNIYKVEARHFVLMLITAAAGRQGWKSSDYPDYYLFKADTNAMADILSLSPQRVRAAIKELIEEGVVEHLTHRDKFKVLGVKKQSLFYNKFNIPIIVAISKDIPYTFKTMLVRLQLSGNNNENSIFTFPTQRSLIKYNGNKGSTLQQNLAILEENNWITHTKGNTVIDLQVIYRSLSEMRHRNELKNQFSY